MKKKRGFTLIELLVVISIIALLMAMLMPTLSKAKEQTYSLVCQTRLKQLGVAWSMYCDDNKGLYPPTTLAWQYLDKYIQATDSKATEIFFCPKATKLPLEGGSPAFQAWEERGYRGSYGINGYCSQSKGGGRGDKIWRTPYVKKAAKIPCVVDNQLFQNTTPLHADEPPPYEGAPSSGNINEIRRACINRHGNGQINGVFNDWAVRSIDLKELWELEWHKNWNDEQAPPPVWPNWMKKFKDYAR
jgi:prepilin-type N-terminal cleavage/methylation domain-containing protein